MFLHNVLGLVPVGAGGGGPRNPFGLDFASGGFVWSTSLCQKDSDGDGRTNGVELGDPDCVWKPGDEPAQPAQSHPGVVDQPSTQPLDDPCAGYQPPEDVVAMDISFTQPNVLDGSKRTEYICEQRTLTAPTTAATAFHQVKTQVINQEGSVLHHIWIYACDGVTSSDGARVDQGPYSCNGIEGECGIIAGWAVGAKDYCEPPNVGAYIDFGSSNGKVFKIEAHYDNTQLKPTTDQSGMRLHFTPTLRPLDSSVVVLGMDYWDREFLIPGSKSSHSLTNICPIEATSRLSEPLYAYSWNPHMHLYGKTMVSEHYRCGQKIGELGRIGNFEFDNQQTYLFPKPIKILPGDSIVTTCTYDTTAVTPGPVLGGEETTDEMCDNYLSFYPYIGTATEPQLFTACSSFARGLNPLFAGFDDSSPFATLDLSGELFVDGFTSDPTNSVADCCATDNTGAACEALYLATNGNACAENGDCISGFCNKGLCAVNTFATPSPTVGAGGTPAPTPVAAPTSDAATQQPAFRVGVIILIGLVTLLI